MKSQTLRKTAVLVTLAALLVAGAPPADAAFPVIDIPNLIQAIKRLRELSAMYAQGAAQLQQIRLRYQLALQMARNIPNLPARYKAVFATWQPITGPDTFGNTAAWLAAENRGGVAQAQQAYTDATDPLAAMPTSQVAALPPEALARLRADYATMNVASAVQANALATVGAIRANSEALNRQIQQLDADSFSEARGMNTTAALLNKINAADDLILHSIQQSNQLMAALTEEAILRQKASHDITAGAIDASIAYRQQFPQVMTELTANMTQDLETFQFSTEQ